jgi:hypothetical protein
MMSETADIAEQRDRGGRFVNGGKAGPGRPKGARSRLSEAFIQDVHTVWEETGIQALRACAAEKPSEFCRIVGLLMPRDVNLTVGIDPAAFADRFRNALELLGNPAPPTRLRKPLRGQPPMIIEHDDVDRR